MLKINFKTTLVALSALLLSLTASAQGSEIRGKVSDESGPVSGVSVVIKGSAVGTATASDGTYRLKRQKPTDILVFSLLGYEEKEVAPGSKTVLDVQMAKASLMMDELVVIGYGVQKKSHLTGAIAKFDASAIVDIPASDVATALQGRLSGVTIQNTTSEVGAMPEIRIRGGGSISTDQQPLMIVDGFEMPDALSLVNANDIQSIEILKDASSAAIYGSKAASGVILITTKSGSDMKPRYTVNYYHGVKMAYKLHDMMTSNEYLDVMNKEFEWGGAALSKNDLAAAWLEEQLGPTDWQREGLRDNATTDNLQISISGGRSNVKYLLSGGFTNDQGLMKQNYNNKANFRTKIDAQLNKFVTIGGNMAAAYSKSQRPDNNYIDFARFPQWVPVFHNEFTSQLTGQPVGSYAQASHFNLANAYPIGVDGAMTTANPYDTQNMTPASRMYRTDNNAQQYQLASNIYMNVQISKRLLFRTANSLLVRYSPKETYRGESARKDGEESEGTFTSTFYSKWVSDNTLTWNWKCMGHDINVMGGISAEGTKATLAGIDGINYVSDNIHTLNNVTAFKVIDDNGKMLTGTYKTPTQNMLSFFGRVNYSYKDKYLLSAMMRTDGYSCFDIDNRWGYFPSVSAGWIVSNEDFMKDQRVVNMLKVRASYGVTGNNRIDPLATVTALSRALYSFGDDRGTIYSGLGNTDKTYGNSSVTWEQVNEYDLGLDLGMFKGRVNLTVDAYYAITKSMLFLRPISPITGYTKQWVNQGKVRNKGLEFTLDTHNISNKNFRWTTAINLSLNRNRLLDLGGEESIKWEGGYKERYINSVGQPTIQFYGFKTDGVWTSAEQLANGVKFGNSSSYDRLGGLRAVDTNHDNELNDKDLVVIGSPYPDFTWGMTNTLSYKGFDLSFLFQGVQGGQIINGDATYKDFQLRDEKFNIRTRWVSEAHPGDGKTPTRNGIPWILTDYDVEDATYVCLRNVTFGYTLPAKTSKKIGMSKMRVYVTGNNLLYFWSDSYRGINPEYRNLTGYPYDQKLVSGFQRGSFPLVTTITAGLDINF